MSSPAPSVSGELPTKAGLLKATIVPGAGRNQLQSVSFGGTFKAEPPGILAKRSQKYAVATGIVADSDVSWLERVPQCRLVLLKLQIAIGPLEAQPIQNGQ